jgi:hypothetical protein
MSVHLDLIRDLSAFADPYHTVLALGVGAPHTPLGIETDAIGANGRGQLRPNPAVAQRAIHLDVEGGQTMAESSRVGIAHRFLFAATGSQVGWG